MTLEQIKEQESGWIFTRDEWLDAVQTECLIDYDGWGYAVVKCDDGFSVKKGYLNRIFPTQAIGVAVDKRITHILWLNR